MVLTADTIQRRKVFKGGNYSRKYGMPQIQKTKKTKESARSMKNIIQIIAFLQNGKNPETEIFVFCVITFDPITI